MDPYQQQAPNCDRLLHYIKNSQWQHVSANFTGFVKKELESVLEKLDEKEGAYPNLQRLVRDAELGRFTNTKELREQAQADLRDIQQRLADLEYEKKNKHTPRGYHMNNFNNNIQQTQDRFTPVKGRQETYSPLKSQRDGFGTNRHETYSPTKRNTYTPQKRDTYSPQKRSTYTPQLRETYTPQKQDSVAQRRDLYTPKKHDDFGQRRDTYTPQKQDNLGKKRDTFTPEKRPPYSPMKGQRDLFSPGNQNRGNPESDGYRYQTPGRHDIAERGPHTPIKNDKSYDQQTMDPHKQNFDSLRLKSPDKGYVDDTPRHVKQGSATSKDQSASSSALWGRDHGDSTSEKIANSTYRQAFPGHNVDNSERQDRNRYRENFSSLNERTSWARMENGGNPIDRRPTSEKLKMLGEPGTPDHRPRMELVLHFKDLFNTEWKDAYDETCSIFGGPEKTVRHLLWVVTEAYLISCDIADHQLRDLEKHAFGVMVTPGPENEAWLISKDIADNQLKDLQNNSVRIMTIPGSASTSLSQREHLITSYRGRELGDALPKSKSLLIQYRKHTAPLSVPYVKETCRDKISRTLMESVNFPKTYLNDASRLVAYIYKCGELTWMMAVSDPPVILEYITKDTEGARFNKDHYVEYTRGGTYYDYGVWPLLRHGKNGKVLWKGIAQGI